MIQKVYEFFFKNYFLAKDGFEPGTTRASPGRRLRPLGQRASYKLWENFRNLNYLKIEQFSDGLQGQEWTKVEAPLVLAFVPNLN